MNDSLRIRITVTVLLLIIVPLLLLATINGYKSSSYLRDQSLALQKEITLRVENELKSYIDVRVDALSILVSSVDFLALDRHMKKSKINRFLMRQHVYQELILLDSDGMEEVHLSRTDAMHPSVFEDRSKEDMFLFPKNSGQIYFGNVYFDHDLREPLLTVALPIVNRRDNRFKHVLVAVMRFKEIWNVLSDMSLPNSIEVYLAQEDGTVIAHKNMAKVINRETLDIQKNNGKGKVIDGEKIIAVRRDLHLGKQTLIVYSTQPVSIAMKLVSENLQFVAVITLLVLLLIAPAVVFLTYRLFKPIKVLAKAARAMSDGDLSVQVTEPARGEILELKNAFNTMAERLKVVVAELENSEFAERERALVTLKSIGDAVISTDVSGKIDFINPIGETLTGWSSEESVGLPLYDVFHIISEETRELAENPVSRCLREGIVVGLANHTLLISRTGVEYAIEDSAAPICGKDGQILGVVLVFKDVTEQINTRKELLKVKKLESIGVLAGGIAHDFNNILTAILGNINLAALDSHLSPNTKNLLDEAEKASHRAKGLTQQLLTFAKGGDPVKEAASLESVIKDSAKFILQGDKVACRYEIPEGLWLVDIDKGQMSQVVQNIVLNASHAMPGGGTIQISCKNIDPLRVGSINLPRDKKFVEIAIIDGGIGIPSNLIEKIFDPYFSTKQKGSGLGLAISHSIITKHNGHIVVKSTPGVGTTFTLYIPASTQQHEQEKRAESIEDRQGKAKIMVMDDEELVKDVAKTMLTRLGHEVVLAYDGAEALNLYKEYRDSGEPIDIVIMDLTIPGGMGGQDAVKEVLTFDSGAKVIVSSGYSNDPVMANYQEYGFCAAIVKPYQLQELTRVINQVMAQRQQ